MADTDIDALVAKLKACYRPSEKDDAKTEPYNLLILIGKAAAALEAMQDEEKRLVGVIAAGIDSFEKNIVAVTQRAERAEVECARLRATVSEVRAAGDVARTEWGKCIVECARLRKDAATRRAINRAAAELSPDFTIGIEVERGAASVELWKDGEFVEAMDVDADDRLTAEINAAIDAARKEKL